MPENRKVKQYKEALQRVYDQKKDAGLLSSFLEKPTKTDIKKWMDNYLSKDVINNDDLDVLKRFSGSSENFEVIKKELVKPDRYQTISKQFRLGIKTGKIEILDLIALIINFEQRPFSTFDRRDFLEVNISPSDINKINTSLKTKILKEYKENPDFNSISINGDRDKTLGVLPMDEYYIQMSYLDGYDITNKDIIEQLERESSLIKSKYRSTDLSQGYFADSVLQNSKVIISGNPGFVINL